MASLHKTWYRCDVCSRESDSTEVVHNKIEMAFAHHNLDLKESCDECAWKIKAAVQAEINKIRDK